MQPGWTYETSFKNISKNLTDSKMSSIICWQMPIFVIFWYLNFQCHYMKIEWNRTDEMADIVSVWVYDKKREIESQINLWASHCLITISQCSIPRSSLFPSLFEASFVVLKSWRVQLALTESIRFSYWNEEGSRGSHYGVEEDDHMPTGK